MRGVITVGAALLLCASTAIAAAEQPICADRPGKANGTCTAPAGHFQLETGIADWTLERSHGARDTTLVLGATAIKYGLTDRAHIELDVTPFVRTTSRVEGVSDSASGFGDSLLRYKYRLTRGGSPVELTFYPFVKLPTARHGLGNGKVEAGVEFPINITIGKSGVSIAFDPEVDLLADSDGKGRHLATVQAMDLNVPLGPRLTITGEIWGRWDFDPAGTIKQFSADAAFAYLVRDSVQLDAGANFGLNKQTPDVEVYAGVSKRF